MKHSTGKPTKAERERFEQMKERIGCICCWLAFGVRRPCDEIHHIIQGNRRLGHWYSLSLCRAHHQGKEGGLWTSIAMGSKAFARIHGTEMDLWLKTQHILGLSDELPRSKVMARRVA